MERKRRLYHIILTVVSACIGCSHHRLQDTVSEYVDVTLEVNTELPAGKSIMPEEGKISDINILAFDKDGDLHTGSYHRMQDKVRLRLRKGENTDIFVCLNFGKEISVDKIEGMQRLEFRMSTPYDYHDGIPMTATLEDFVPGEDTVIMVKPERIMSKISMRIDRSRLDDDINMKVNNVFIGNCPSSAFLFSKADSRDSSGYFASGFHAEGTEKLNSQGTGVYSDEIELYLLENVNADMPSYIEMEMEYFSDSLFTTDIPLIYRMHIDEDRTVERNCHYHITVQPCNDGLPDDGWRIDKSGLHAYIQEIRLSQERLSFNYHGQERVLVAEIIPEDAFRKDMEWSSSDPTVATVSPDGTVTATGEGTCRILCSSRDGKGAMDECRILSEFAPPSFVSYPAEKYIVGDIGDTLRLHCEVFPPNASFDIGMEYLQADHENGIYDYTVDDDGYGVTLVLTGPGSGLIYMEAGPPVNDAALYFIEVNMEAHSR